ncbi:hypothetical protein BH10ACT7_BH10ACT7_22800 [soil metagenome]
MTTNDDTPLETPRPRIRASAITWGLIVATVASVTLYIVTVPARREGFLEWLLALSAGDFALIAIATGGAIVLVAGVLSAARSLQRK